MNIVIKFFSLYFMDKFFSIFVLVLHKENFSFSAIYKVPSDQSAYKSRFDIEGTFTCEGFPNSDPLIPGMKEHTTVFNSSKKEYFSGNETIYNKVLKVEAT